MRRRPNTGRNPGTQGQRGHRRQGGLKRFLEEIREREETTD
jgi:hypothetical protein